MDLTTKNEPLSKLEFQDIVWDSMPMKLMSDEYWFKHKEFLEDLTKDLYVLYKERYNPFEGSASLLGLYGKALETICKNIMKYDPIPRTNNKEYS
jgi:hypothetical protein|tara:strand:+ start:244 stop:528 length:285 start_codon:yes stop_codon:yes gene_type:complete